MNRSKHIGVLLIGMLLWTGVGWLAPGALHAGESDRGRQADRPAAGTDRVIRVAGTLEPADYVELRNEVGLPLPIISVVPQGKAVKKGDLLVELDAISLVDKRMQQSLRRRKAEAELVLAKMSQEREERAAKGQIQIAEKTLSLAQSQRKAFTEGEYPHQLAIAEAAAALARERGTMAEERARQLRASLKAQEDQAAQAMLIEAAIASREASLQAAEAEGSLKILKSFLHGNRIAELELVVAQREFDLARAKDALSEATSRGKVGASLAEVSLGVESDCLALLDDQIAKSRIYAPRDGTVLYANDASTWETGQTMPKLQAGAIVRERQAIIRVADMTKLQLEVRTSLQVARRVETGYPATIYFTAFPERAFRGRVARVRLLLDEAIRPDEGSITIPIDEPSKELRPGMAARVNIDLPERPVTQSELR